MSGVTSDSPTLHAAQARGFDQTLAKTTRALTELADTLARGRRDRDAVQTESPGSPGRAG